MTDPRPALFECDVETLPLFDPPGGEQPEPHPQRLTIGDHVRGLAERRWLTVAGYWATNR